jgi:hypothetical protein
MTDIEKKETNVEVLDPRLAILNRSYRLVAAIFVVLKIIDGEEQLKTRLKDLSLELLSLTSTIKDCESATCIKETERVSAEIVSLVEVAVMSGLVSEMNGAVLKSEFTHLTYHLNLLKTDAGVGSSAIVKNILKNGSDEYGEGVAVLGNNVPNNQIGHKIGHENHHVTYNMSDKTYNGHFVNEENKGKKRKELRKDLILEYIKNNKDVSIKDIIPNIKGCSEKTIQRELVTLIRENKIIRSGDRRWSKYSASV